jgi:hypothetical protein
VAAFDHDAGGWIEPDATGWQGFDLVPVGSC